MKLIDEARQFWRWWSVRLAAVAGLIAGYLTANPTALSGLVTYVPEDWRPLASLLVGLLVFAVPTLARLIAQPVKENSGG